MATLREVLDSTPELAGLTYPEAAAWLNAAPEVPNPQPQGTVPAPVTLAQVMALVPDAEAAKCYRLPGLIEDMRRAMDGNNHAWLGKLLGIALADGAITQATAAQLQPLLTATVPDPAWAATVPGPARWAALGLSGPVSAADVQGERHAAAE
jgi:hypothetical protein